MDWFVEDHTSFYVRLQSAQQRERHSPYGVVAYGGYSHDDLVAMGVTVRFLGRVSAPGLFETMTPLR